jgi:hypothetical protein
MYSDYWDEKHVTWRMFGVMPLVRAMPERARKPVYITEFGFRGTRHGKEEPGRHLNGKPLYETPVPGAMNAWIMMQAMNEGYVAAVQWDMMDIIYDRSRMYYGLIGEPAKGFPLKPTYWMTYLFTHTMKPGWRAVRVVPNEKQSEKLVVAAMTGTKGELSVYALNRLNGQETFTIGGLGTNVEFKSRVWNEDGKGGLSGERMISSDAGGRITLPLKSQSLVALSR